jgi:ketosteroid isomerase-like protein
MDTAATVEAVPRLVVDNLFQAYAARDHAALSEALADDVEWTISGPVNILPFCGTERGKARVLDLLTNRVPAVLTLLNFARAATLVDGDQVAALNRVTARHTSDGRLISYRAASFLRFRNRKLVWNLVLMDSFDAAEQVLGQSLDPYATPRDGDLIAV